MSLIKQWGMVVMFVALLVGPTSAASWAETTEKTSAFTEAQKAEMGPLMRDYLLDHPEILKEVADRLSEKMRKEEEQQQAAALERNKNNFYTAGVTPTFGNPKGDVDLIVFFDYNCGYCHAAAPLIKQLVKEDPNVRIVMREFPILSKTSDEAARAALAANKQGKYAEFHDAALSTEDGHITTEQIISIAKLVGLNMDKFEKDRQAFDIDAEIKRSYDLAEQLHIRGTPAFVVGKRLYPGMMDLQSMHQAVEEQRKTNASNAKEAIE